MPKQAVELKGRCALSDVWLGRHASVAYPPELSALFSAERLKAAQDEIMSWNGYAPTPLRSLDDMAEAAGVGAVLYKDEAPRFGLGSFKALGGAYAVLRHVAAELTVKLEREVTPSEVRSGSLAQEAASITVATATDGNHGRSVAWGAQQAGCGCKIYIHAEVSKGREEAMAAYGADVIRIDGDYDESVRLAASEAETNGWQVISDTSYDGYMDVPRDVMAGYTVMVREIMEQAEALPSHVIIQAGVGGLAAAICAPFWAVMGENRPRLIITESEHAACILQSVRKGEASHVAIDHETIMAGLSCGEISLIAWEILSRGANAVATIGDGMVPPFMRHLAAQGIEAGECAVPGLITLMGITNQPDLAAKLGLDEKSRVLVFGCEGATDPDLYRSIINGAD